MRHPNIIETEEAMEAIIRAAKSVAVIGMKDESEPDVPAHEIPKASQKRGLRIVPVNPKIHSALGERAWPSLAAVPERVDIVNVFRRSEAIRAIADEVLALPLDKRPAVFWMQTGIRHEEAAEVLAAAGIKVVQDHCLGVYAARVRPRATANAVTT